MLPLILICSLYTLLKKPNNIGKPAYISWVRNDGYDILFFCAEEPFFTLVRTMAKDACYLYIKDLHPEFTNVRMIQKLFKSALRGVKKNKVVIVTFDKEFANLVIVGALVRLGFHF